MKTWKKDTVYFFILLFSSFQIYHTFRMAFSDVKIQQTAEISNIFLLSLPNYAGMTAGLLLTAFTVYLYLHMSSYIVGKLFALYLTLISIVLCFSAITPYGIARTGFIGALLLLSNLVLYYLTGYLVIAVKKTHFKWSTKIFILLSLVLTFSYFICLKSDRQNHLCGTLISADYILTLAAIILNMLHGYRDSTVYSRKQAKFFLSGLLIGGILFVAMQFMPLLAVVNMPEQPTENGHSAVAYPQIVLQNPELYRNIYPIGILIGIIITMTYILIKREYLPLDDSSDLKRYLASILFLTAADTCFWFLWYDGAMSFVLYHLIILLPLLICSHQAYSRSGTAYDSNLTELLENERQRLSVFLHDEILQDVIALSYTVKSDEEKEKLSAVISEIRNISQDLYPTIVEDLGVNEALKIFMADIRNDYNVELEYQYAYPDGILPVKTALTLYRTVKELVTNAIKHAHCSRITVLITAEQNNILGIVTDNGTGFCVPENETLLKSPHMGIYTIKKQIAALNGTLRIISDETGSIFQFQIPLK